MFTFAKLINVIKTKNKLSFLLIVFLEGEE